MSISSQYDHEVINQLEWEKSKLENTVANLQFKIHQLKAALKEAQLLLESRNQFCGIERDPFWMSREELIK